MGVHGNLPLKQRIKEMMTRNSACRRVIYRFIAQQANNEAKAPPPEPIAASVERVLCDPGLPYTTPQIASEA
jgi:hypothetical protein